MVRGGIETGRDLGLAGRRIIVTGAAQGVGAATARLLAGMGAAVVLADYRDPAEIAAECGPLARAATFDLADPAAVADLVAGAEGLYGLVNCAALLVRTPFETLDNAVMEREIAVNQTGALHLARAALAAMRAGGQGGRIVMLTSQGAHTGGYYGSTSYAMTKAAVGALVKSLARMGAADGVTANAVAPGAVDTPMLRGGMSEADLAAFRDRIPMARFADPAELAATAAFLLSDWAGYVTGATLHVNGGQYMP